VRWRQAVATAAGTALALAASGCGAQAEPGYLGEPLVTLTGRVAPSQEASALPLEAAVLWQKGALPTTGDQVLAARAPVEGGAFTVRLYQPPPAEVLRPLAPGEVAFARATAASLPFGLSAPDVSAPATTASPAYGIDPGHWLLYLAGDVPPGSLTAWWLGQALPAGYHVVRVTPTCLTAAELEACAGTVAALGVPDTGTPAAGTARAYCLAPYRLAAAPAGEALVLALGTTALPAAGGTCP
jgi:hypothetical protein